MSTGDRFITLFGTGETDSYTQDERLAFLQGYHNVLELHDPKRPLSIAPENHAPPSGLEEPYRAGQARAQSDLEEKKAMDAAVIAAVIAAI